MDSYDSDTTRPDCASAVKIRLFAVADTAEVWAVWSNTKTSDDLLGFAVSPDGHHWTARGYGETYDRQEVGFPSRRAAAEFLMLTGGVKPTGVEVVEVLPAESGLDVRQAGLWS